MFSVFAFSPNFIGGQKAFWELVKRGTIRKWIEGGVTGLRAHQKCYTHTRVPQMSPIGLLRAPLTQDNMKLVETIYTWHMLINKRLIKENRGEIRP